MSELRERCREFARCHFPVGMTHTPYRIDVDALEAFARAEQIRGMEAARRFVAEQRHHAPGTILARLDAEIAKLKEGGHD